MKVYWDRIPIDDVPNRIRRPGELFTRLVGLNVSSDGKSVEPLYVPLVRLHRRAGQVLVEINSDRPLVYLTLQRRRPFLNIFVFPWRLWDRDEPEIA